MPKLHRKPFLVMCLFAALAVALPALAQNSSNPADTAPAASTPPNGDTQAEDQTLETLKVNVQVVQLFFNVKDKHGALIPTLNKSDFDLSEDGKPQTIKYFK